MSMVNPVSRHRLTGDGVTEPARPPRKPRRGRAGFTVYRGNQPTPMPEQIVGALAVIQGLQSELLQRLEKLGDSPTLFSGTRQINASGLAGVHINAGYRAFHVSNLGSHNMTVLEGPPNDNVNPQFIGPGVFTVAGAHWLTMPLTGNSLTIVGTPGDLARIAVYGIALPAAAGFV